MAEQRILGGDALTRRLNEIAVKLRRQGSVKVGFLGNATYPNGTPVALIAVIQDFGAPSRNIPPRPFFRNMVAQKSGEWPNTFQELLRQNDYDLERVLRLMGEGIKGQLQQSIRDTNEPPLAPATIKRKGFPKPLIDTGQLLNSVDYEVEIS